MGDRANVVIRESWPEDLGDKEAVFLYTHWGGYELPEVVRTALSMRWRWDDSPYLARVVFDTMTNLAGEETGYGISTRIDDNEYDLIVLHEGKLYRVPEAAYKEKGLADLGEYPAISFENYIAVPRNWENLTVPVEAESRV